MQIKASIAHSTSLNSDKKPLQFGPSPLSKDTLLRKQCGFLYTKKEGNVFVGRFMVVNLAVAPDETTRIGIIVSKRYCKKAVNRNRARRLVKESFRLIKNRLISPVWLVVVVRKKNFRPKSTACSRRID